MFRGVLFRSVYFRSSAARVGSDERKCISTAATSYLLKHYDKIIASSSIGVSRDEHQAHALTELDRLRNDLLTGGNDLVEGGTTGSIGEGEEREASASALFSLFFKNTKKSSRLLGPSSTAPKGVYLHGGVGCGKTFCMDLFYDSIPTDSAITSQKVHFHKFMLDVHKQVCYIILMSFRFEKKTQLRKTHF
mmetsp:Transcript_2926/g.4199  ORF Transcript_2926/g.4199 Transcript_2926/m.4199 type:complete len:191 (+) Transcript_2926:169-741(+)